MSAFRQVVNLLSGEAFHFRGGKIRNRTGKPVPTPLQQQIDTLRISIEKQKVYIAGKNAEKDSSAQRFAAELAHYREVQARTGSQQQ